MSVNRIPVPVRESRPGDALAVRPGRWQRWPGWLVVLIPAAVAVALGGFRLGGPSLWRDEAYTISAAQRSTGQLLAMLVHVDAVHGAYYLVMHYVVKLIGSSAVALRLPSLIGMGVAAAVTAALGRQLAVQAGWPAPAATGLLAGLFFAAAPQTAYYAQDARPYGPVIMFAVIASYLLVRAHADGGRRWWTAYGVSIALIGLCNAFALLLAGTHAVTLLLARASAGRASQAQGAARTRHAARPDRDSTGLQPPGPQPPGSQPHDPEPPRRPSAGPPSAAPEPPGLLRPAAAGQALGAGGWWRITARPWLIAVAAAVAVLLPMIIYGYRQSATLNWAGRPGPHAIGKLASDLAGSYQLIALVTALVLCGAIAGWRPGRPGGVTMTGLALPWLFLPSILLIAVSQIHPAYVERYVVFSLPAVALLCAAGLTWLAQLAAATRAGQRRPALAWLPAMVIIVAVGILLVAPQQRIRRPHARADNLRAVAQVIGRHKHRGDVICYLPLRTRVAAFAYPDAFRGLRNVEQDLSPVASDSLSGTQALPSVVIPRLASAHRVWLLRWHGKKSRNQFIGGAGKATLDALAGMKLQRQWHTESITISLYVRAASPRLGA